jgi:hypothetical protein
VRAVFAAAGEAATTHSVLRENWVVAVDCSEVDSA